MITVFIRHYWHLTMPFVMPFVVLGLFRAMSFTAGAEWSEPSLMAQLSTVIGVTAGVVIVAITNEVRK